MQNKIKLIFITLIMSFTIINPWCVESNSKKLKGKINKLSDFYMQDYGILLGITPDGKNLLTFNKDLYEYLIIDIIDYKIIKTIPVNNQDYYMPAKKAIWSNNGNMFVLYSTQNTPVELKYLRGMYIYAINIQTNEIITVSDNKFKNKIFDKNFALYFNPTFSVDDKSIIYHSFTNNNFFVIKKNLYNENEKILIKSAKTDLYYTIQLDKNKIIYSKDSFQSDSTPSIALHDLKTNKVKKIIELSKKEPQEFYDIKNFSKDRRRILVNHIKSDMGTLKIINTKIIDFNKKFTNFKITDIPIPDNHFIINTVLSKDGNYVIYTLIDSQNSPDMDCILLYDIENTKTTSLFSNQELIKNGKKPILYPGFPADKVNMFTDGLIMSEDYKIIIWFNDHYEVFQLE